MRPDAATRQQRIDHLRQRIELVYASLLDEAHLRQVIGQCRPNEVYNFAARASSSQLFADPVLTGDFNGLAVVRLLEAIRAVDTAIRFCQASSSEMFGEAIAISAGRIDAVSPAQSLWCGQAVRARHGRHVSRELRPVCLLQHLVQSRKPSPRSGVRDSQDRDGCGKDQGRTGRISAIGKLAGHARLGLCRGLCAMPCGGCCRRSRRMIMLSRLARAIPFGSFASSPLRMSAWIIAATYNSIRVHRRPRGVRATGR